MTRTLVVQLINVHQVERFLVETFGEWFTYKKHLAESDFKFSSSATADIWR